MVQLDKTLLQLWTSKGSSGNHGNKRIDREMSLIQGCKQSTANSCEWKCIKWLDERDGMLRKKRGGEAGRRRGSGLMEANSTGFVKDDLITSSPVCWDLCLFSLSTVLDCFSLSILFFAAVNLAANLIKLTITLCGETRAHRRGGAGGSFWAEW